MLSGTLAFSVSISLRLRPSTRSKQRPGIRCAVSGHEVQLKRSRTVKTRKHSPNPLIAKFLGFRNALQEIERISRPGAQAQSAGETKNRYNSLPEVVKGTRVLLCPKNTNTFFALYLCFMHIILLTFVRLLSLGKNQMLGRMSPGCEGTHGVFPKVRFYPSPVSITFFLTLHLCFYSLSVQFSMQTMLSQRRSEQCADRRHTHRDEHCASDGLFAKTARSRRALPAHRRGGIAPAGG